MRAGVFHHFFQKNVQKIFYVNHPRIELGPNAWKASILTIILAIRIIVVKSWKFFAIYIYCLLSARFFYSDDNKDCRGVHSTLVAYTT